VSRAGNAGPRRVRACSSEAYASDVRAALIVGVSGLLLVAACGDGGGSSDSADGELAIETIAAAPDRVAEAGSYRVEGSVDFDAAAPFGAEFTGEFDTETSAASIEQTFEGPEVNGAGFETRVVDGVLYMDVEGLFEGFSAPIGELPPGVNWIEINAPVLTNALGAASAGNLTATLESLRGVSDDVTEVGTEDIRGVETTHYRAEVDPARALDEAQDQLDQLPETQREAVGDNLESLGDELLVVDVWIDDDGLVRRQEMAFDAVIAGETTHAVTTIEIFDYGADIEIEAPPPDETATFEEIFGVSPEDIDQLGSVLS